MKMTELLPSFLDSRIFYVKVFFRSSRPGYPHPVCSDLEKKVTSEWRSVTAVLMNLGAGVHLIKPTQNTTYTEVMCLIRFRTPGLWHR